MSPHQTDRKVSAELAAAEAWDATRALWRAEQAYRHHLPDATAAQILKYLRVLVVPERHYI